MTLDRGSVSYICHVIPTNLINKCHFIGHFNSQLLKTCLDNYTNIISRVLSLVLDAVFSPEGRSDVCSP